MAPKAKPKPKATLIQKHAAEQRQQTKPTQGKTWEYVCDCNEDGCDKCAPRKKIDTFEPAHVARRSMVPARLQDELSVPARAAVRKAGEEAKPPKPPEKEETVVTVVSPAREPTVLGERKRVRGH